MTSDLGRIKILGSVPHVTANFAPIWLAKDLGYTEEEGLDVVIELAGSPKDAVEGVIAGRGDMSFVNIVFSFLAYDRGVPYCPFYAFVRRQNRSFSVPEASPIWTLSDLRGRMIGLHYDDPELRAFARAALVGAGLDPDRDVTFKPLAGSPLDAPRMAAAIRDGEVEAVWQLDVLSGLMAGEGLPLRRLPAPAIDGLTPSSCLEAMASALDRRPEAFGAIGRAIAKATLFAIANPAAAVRTLWRHHLDAGPQPGEDPEHAFRRELAALEVRLASQHIEGALDPRWGAITEAESSAWQEFLLASEAIATRRPPSIYYSNALVETFNAFDPRPVMADARVWLDK
jgi:NitT/TauT family transport system substrate-binding protein